MVVQRNSYQNPGFNKGNEMVFEWERLEKELAKELFFNQGLLKFEGASIRNVVYARSYGAAFNRVLEISNRVS